MTDTILTEGARFSKLIDEALADYLEDGIAFAKADHKYSQAKAVAWAQAPEGTVAQKEAWVGLETEVDQLEYNIAKAKEKITLEVLRSRRQQLSHIQSLLKHPEMTLEATMAGQI